MSNQKLKVKVLPFHQMIKMNVIILIFYSEEIRLFLKQNIN